MGLIFMHTRIEFYLRTPALPWILALSFLALSIPCPISARQSEKIVTTIFLARHAEKDSIPAGDPPLAVQGRERAAMLAHTLGKAGITSIVTTELQRTRETAAPLANSLNIIPTVIPVIWDQSIPRKISPRFYAELVKHIRKNEGGTILVIGHSNTIPELIRVLGGPGDIQIGETEFDHLFTVDLSGGAVHKVLNLRYGVDK